MKAQVKRFRHLADTVRALIERDQKARYRTATMGVFWAVASPLLYLLTFYLLFKVVLPLQVPNYAAHLFIGIVVWGWFQGAVMESTSSIVSNAGLLVQPGFPSRAIPLAVAGSHLVTLLLTLPVLMLLLAGGGGTFGPQLVALPLVVLSMAVFVLAACYLVAGLAVPFRDMQHIVPILLQLGYFATPIFYDWRVLPEPARSVLGLNPMLRYVEAFRDVLMRGAWPDWGALALVTAGAGLFLALAVALFRRASLRFLEEL